MTQDGLRVTIMTNWYVRGDHLHEGIRHIACERSVIFIWKLARGLQFSSSISHYHCSRIVDVKRMLNKVSVRRHLVIELIRKHRIMGHPNYKGQAQKKRQVLTAFQSCLQFDGRRPGMGTYNRHSSKIISVFNVAIIGSLVSNVRQSWATYHSTSSKSSLETNFSQGMKGKRNLKKSGARRQFLQSYPYVIYHFPHRSRFNFNARFSQVRSW